MYITSCSYIDLLMSSEESGKVFRRFAGLSSLFGFSTLKAFTVEAESLRSCGSEKLPAIFVRSSLRASATCRGHEPGDVHRHSADLDKLALLRVLTLLSVPANLFAIPRIFPRYGKSAL
jgi:hypothetical protein